MPPFVTKVDRHSLYPTAVVLLSTYLPFFISHSQCSLDWKELNVLLCPETMLKISFFFSFYNLILSLLDNISLFELVIWNICLFDVCFRYIIILWIQQNYICLCSKSNNCDFSTSVPLFRLCVVCVCICFKHIKNAFVKLRNMKLAYVYVFQK